MYAAHSLDAIFLDLPEPWRALKYVPHVLKPDRNICCYSPCVEQVIKTCDKLRELGFHSIRMFEVRQKPHTAYKISLDVADIGQKLESKYSFPTDIKHEDVEKVSEKEEEEHTAKKLRLEDGSSTAPVSTEVLHSASMKHYRPRTLPPVSVSVARPDATMKGHTAYLTFATAPASFTTTK